MKVSRLLPLLLVGIMLFSAAAIADDFQGTLYYTRYSGFAQNVWSLDFHYDDTTNTVQLTNNQAIGATTGADGIIFTSSGSLLVGGQNFNRISEITTGGALLNTTFLQDQSYHLALSPDGTKVFTSNFGGDLSIAGLTGGHLNGTQSLNNVTGSDQGLTQVAFAPNGNVFYVNGNPNGGGNVGMIDLSTFVTARDFTAVNSAHGLIYDPFTGLMTLFGHGHTGTFATDGTGLKESSSAFTCDFDQGAVDGFGHALVAGCNQVTFLDYSGSGDITNPNFVKVFNAPTDGSYGNFINIDDVAPLVGPGSRQNVPEPASMIMLGSGIVGIAGLMRRRMKK